MRVRHGPLAQEAGRPAAAGKIRAGKESANTEASSWLHGHLAALR